jgi:hypothetical protein
MVLDAWQRPLTDTGLPGPDKGQGAKYLILPPGSPDIQADGYRVFRSPTFNIMVGTRALHPDPAKADEWIKQLRLYPYAQRDNPPVTRFLKPEGRKWSQVPPRGLAYWERLADILNREPVAERDHFFMAMLAPLGIEKSKPFKPDARQKKLFEEATFVGEIRCRLEKAVGERSRHPARSALTTRHTGGNARLNQAALNWLAQYPQSGVQGRRGGCIAV